MLSCLYDAFNFNILDAIVSAKDMIIVIDDITDKNYYFDVLKRYVYRYHIDSFIRYNPDRTLFDIDNHISCVIDDYLERLI